MLQGCQIIDYMRKKLKNIRARNMQGHSYPDYTGEINGKSIDIWIWSKDRLYILLDGEEDCFAERIEKAREVKT